MPVISFEVYHIIGVEVDMKSNLWENSLSRTTRVRSRKPRTKYSEYVTVTKPITRLSFDWPHGPLVFPNRSRSLKSLRLFFSLLVPFRRKNREYYSLSIRPDVPPLQEIGNAEDDLEGHRSGSTFGVLG